jgi:type IV secretory pathway VirB3-like protein
LLLFLPIVSFAGNEVPLSVFGIRIEFVLFSLILICVAIFNKNTFWVSLIGLTILLFYKLFSDTTFNIPDHFFGSAPLIDQLINKDLRQGE